LKCNIDVRWYCDDMCTTSKLGDYLYNVCINPALSREEDIVLNFSRVSFVTSCFLQAAVGQAYSKYKPEFIKEHLSITGMSQEDMVTLKRVVDGAKLQFKERV